MIKKEPGIYTITNIINNKIYVGLTVNLYNRKNSHVSKIQKLAHENPHLQNAVNQYGASNFKFEVLEYCDEEFLCSQENYWCNMLNVHNREYGYNIKSTSPDCKCRMSEEHKRKISESHIGKSKSESHKKSMSEYRKGKPFKFTEAWKNYNERRKGKSRIEVGPKISEAKRSNGPSEKHLNNISKKVINRNTGEIYSSAKYVCENFPLGMKIHCFRARLTGVVENNTEYEYLERYNIN